MNSQAQRRAIQLGESFGTACTKLRKLILFSLLQKYKENICFRCKEEIKTIQELSIEHKKSWLDSNNPKENFYDLSNISFSHLSCNCSNTKLNTAQVLEIRRLCTENKMSLESIAKLFNIESQAIYDIKYRRSWKSI